MSALGLAADKGGAHDDRHQGRPGTKDCRQGEERPLASVDEVVADALAVLDRAEAAERLKADVRADLDEGWPPAERGTSLPADAAVARLWDRINRWRRERHETV